MAVEISVSRRAVLLAGAAGAGTVALVACGSSGGARSAAVGAASSAAAPGSPPGGGATSSASGGGLAKLTDISVGQCVAAKINGQDAIIARPDAATAVAFSAICTHQGCTVAPAGVELHCPCHGSRYNATTGEVLQGPAPAPLSKIAVRVVNGEVVAG